MFVIWRYMFALNDMYQTMVAGYKMFTFRNKDVKLTNYQVLGADFKMTKRFHLDRVCVRIT